MLQQILSVILKYRQRLGFCSPYETLGFYVNFSLQITIFIGLRIRLDKDRIY